MREVSYVLIAGFLVLALYTYVLYPGILKVLARMRRPAPPEKTEDGEWPFVSISVPMYNEEAQAQGLIESLLAIDYPADRRQILVISDASSDRTDEIVRGYADRGVELLRMPDRGGKNKAENAAAEHLRGEIVVNTDASIRIRRDALKPLVAAFRDPTVGCASGRDVSVGADEQSGNAGEGGYVGYEMWIRGLETQVGGIIGASGCFYAIRPELHRLPLPESLSRDFAAALHTHEHGFRAVSVPEAVCLVPRAPALRKEYRRKVRTITRGMETLWHKRALMNPVRHGVFAWKLVSHKVCRWALPWAALVAFGALGVLAPSHVWAGFAFGGGLALLVLAAVGWALAERPRVPKLFSIPAYLVVGNLSAVHASLRALRGSGDALWEPTRRPVVKAG